MIAEQVLFELIDSDLSEPWIITRELDKQMMNDYELDQFPSFYFQTSPDPVLKKLLKGVFHCYYLLPYLVFLAEHKFLFKQRLPTWSRGSHDFTNAPTGLEEEFGILEWLEAEVMRVFTGACPGIRVTDLKKILKEGK